MTRDPLKSALSFGEIGETSLALPSDGDSRSGQQRVMEQVSTMRKSRKKSNYNNRGSAGTLSPTSPKSDSVFFESKFPHTSLNGLDYAYEGTMANGHTKTRKQQQSMMQRSISTRSGHYQRILNNNILPNSLPALNQPSIPADFYGTQVGIKSNTAHWSQKYRQAKSLERSHSQPPQTSPVQTKANNILQATNSHLIISNTINKRPPSAHSSSEPKLSVANRSKSEMNGMNGEANLSDITLSDAISWTIHGDEKYQLHGASVIQHNTYTDDKAKEEVRKLGGIAPLVSLLSSSNPQIQMSSVSALRNLVFKNTANKKEVLRAGGLTEALQLLRNPNLAETQKHVTGLLWNMSSEECIQPDLLRHALPVLTQFVLQPNADILNISSDVEARTECFCNTTACLRNLSSGRLSNRQSLRNCEGLIDSLVTHLQICVDNDHLDDKSVENCVCVLHNLTYQLEGEVPAVFSKINSQATASESRANTSDTGPIGCFSNQSRKVQEESNSEFQPMDDFDPKGKSRLVHKETLQLYLNLLSSSENERTQEACCGALHNLTAKKGLVSDQLNYTIVQRLNGLPSLIPYLQSKNLPLRDNISTLICNLSRTPQLQKMIAHQVLPSLMKNLPSDPTPESDNALAMICHTTNNLLRVNPELGKRYINKTLIYSLSNLSQNKALPKASTAAGALLQSLWSDKTIQGFLKKQGMAKKEFVNEVTSAAVRSLQIIE